MTRHLLILLTIILFSCRQRTSSTTEISSKNEVSSKDGITCIITSDKDYYKTGELPKISVKIKNNTDSTFLFVKSIDGSAEKMRFPYAYFKIEKLNDTTYKTNNYRICGNSNTLDMADFTTIKSGEIFDPYYPDTNTFFDYKIRDATNFKKTGKYRIVFYYSTNEHNFRKWLGDLSDYYRDPTTGELETDYEGYKILLALFNKVPKVDLVSNELTIEIKKN